MEEGVSKSVAQPHRADTCSRTPTASRHLLTASSPREHADRRTMIPVLIRHEGDCGVDSRRHRTTRPDCRENIAAAVPPPATGSSSSRCARHQVGQGAQAWVLLRRATSAGRAATRGSGRSRGRGFKTVHPGRPSTAPGRPRTRRRQVRGLVREVRTPGSPPEREGHREGPGARGEPGRLHEGHQPRGRLNCQNLHLTARLGGHRDAEVGARRGGFIAEAKQSICHTATLPIVTSETGWPDGKVTDTYREL